MKAMLYFLILIGSFIAAPQVSFAGSSHPIVGSQELSWESVKPINQKQKTKKKKRKAPKGGLGKGESLVPAVLFWWVLIPLIFLGLIAASFFLVFPLLWFLGIGIFAIWAGVSGVVFFPIQYFGLPLGMVGLVVGLIIGNVLIWTLGIALLFAAVFAFAYMVLMFMIGTRKYQPK